MKSLPCVTDPLRHFAVRYRIEVLVATLVFVSCGYFFQGGGWNQNAHFATVVALVEEGTFRVDRYRASSGDLAHADGGVASAKPVGTALLSVPAYLVARALTAGIDNHGDRVIVRAYLTAWWTSGLALTVLALLLLWVARRRLATGDAVLVALAMTLATPLYPNSTMLNSHALTCMFAALAYGLLEGPRLAGSPPGRERLFAAGSAAAMPATLEYLTVVILVPLFAYALWQCRPRWRVLFFAGGCGLVLLIPLAHHTVVYGDPLHVGYASLVVERFASDAARGFFGIEGFSLAVLYELTLGSSRGLFFLSPALAAAVPGLVRLLGDRSTRAEGLVCGSIAWGILLIVASLVYWHSGSAVGSRYALLFIPFSAVPVAAVLPGHRSWIAVAIAVGFLLMLMATSVTAIPPPPSSQGPYPNVVGWLWNQFSAANLASWQQPVLVEHGVGDGQPTLPFAFNLGQLAGLAGHLSLLPLAIVQAALGWRLLRALKKRAFIGQPEATAEPQLR